MIVYHDSILIGFKSSDVEEKLKELQKLPGTHVLQLRYKGDTDIPEYRVHFINTPGGLQFAVKQSSLRGEGSGIYFAPEQITEAAEYIHKLARNIAEVSMRSRSRMIAAGGLLEKTAERLNKTRNVLILDLAPYMHIPTPFANSAIKWAESLGGDTVTLN